MTTNDQPKQNTDRELWRESNDRSQCTPSIHVTQDGGIGINVGGTVIVRPIREWHALAAGATNARRIANVADFMAEDDDDTPAPTTVPQPIIATPEQPPFAPKQFVRIKSSGTILNVARCEKRVVHGALRWVVDDLNGMRAFASDCELVKNMELVNAETGQAVIHLPPVVRYACSKEAKVGETVRRIDAANLLRKVTAVNADGSIGVETLEGIRVGNRPALQYEFVPDVTPAADTDFDFDEAANKAATAILNSLAGTTGVSREWASDIISAQIRPGVQALNELQAQKLAACSCAAIMDTPETHDQNKDMKPGNPFWSPAFDDVMRRTSECIKLRKALKDIARPGDCGCRPCRGQCRTQEALEIEIDGLREIAREALAIPANSVQQNKLRDTPFNPAAELVLEQLRQQLAIAKLLLGQCDNRMFLVGDFELRKAPGGWKLFRPPYGALVGNDLKAQVFADPVQAALRAKELADVKGGAA